MKEPIDNPYLLLTPGPLSTSSRVKHTMLRDWCTWDDEYNSIVQDIRGRLVALAGAPDTCTSVLMQGSGTFSVEAVITSAVPGDGKLLILVNGAYGQRMATIASMAGIDAIVQDSGELEPTDLHRLEVTLQQDTSITHVAVVHCETTTGMLNPIKDIGALVKEYGKTYIVDAMSSFGGIPIDMNEIRADYLISSANKCIQGVPGFGFVIAVKDKIARIGGNARSHSLDLYDQWRVMEAKNGKWRFTSPTHVVRAFHTALQELEDEGGVAKRFQRYTSNHKRLVAGMEDLGFECLLEKAFRSPIITAFYNPNHDAYRFTEFYSLLKSKGFVIYPGKVTDRDTFRVGTIGDITPEDIDRLLSSTAACMYWQQEDNS